MSIKGEDIFIREDITFRKYLLEKKKTLFYFYCIIAIFIYIQKFLKDMSSCPVCL
jgi:hypothetical protein